MIPSVLTIGSEIGASGLRIAGRPLAGGATRPDRGADFPRLEPDAQRHRHQQRGNLLDIEPTQSEPESRAVQRTVARAGQGAREIVHDGVDGCWSVALVERDDARHPTHRSLCWRGNSLDDLARSIAPQRGVLDVNTERRAFEIEATGKP